MCALSYKPLFVVIGLTFVCYNEALLGNRVLPCDFRDSVNITTGTIHLNKSIIFNGIEFPEDQYAEVNYILRNGINTTVEPYYRGCPCTKKPCVRLCCPYGSFVVSRAPDGDFICRNDPAARNIKSEIIDENNQTKIVIFDQHFGFVESVCKSYYLADEFQIFHNGLVISEEELFDHREHCLLVTENETKLDLQAMICYDEEDDEHHLRFRILPYVMLTSVPFIIATILVYAFIPDLLTLLGKCLTGYLISLLVYNIALSYVHLKAGEYVDSIPCTVLAYTIYFAYLSAVLWLNVISYNVWQSFRLKTRKHSDRKQFMFYAAYVYTLSTVLPVVFGVIDSIKSLPDHFKPGFGDDTCFVNEDKISKFLYFYLQFCIIYFVNIVFFVLTALKIHRLRQEHNPSGHQSSFNRRKVSFTLYLRLIILVGITWSFDAIAFIAPDSYFFLVCDICNGAQGIFIFVLFVLNKSVFHQIKKRWHTLLGNRSHDLSNGSSSANTHQDQSKEIMPLSPLST